MMPIIIVLPESVKLNTKTDQKPCAVMDCEFSVFHPRDETTKMTKAVAVQGIGQLFANEFHGFRFLLLLLFP